MHDFATFVYVPLNTKRYLNATELNESPSVIGGVRSRKSLSGLDRASHGLSVFPSCSGALALLSLLNIMLF